MKLTRTRSSRQHTCHQCSWSAHSQSDLPSCPLEPSVGHESRTNQTKRTTVRKWWVELSQTTGHPQICVLHLRCGVQIGCGLVARGLGWHYGGPSVGSSRRADPSRLRSATPVPEPWEKHRKIIRMTREERPDGITSNTRWKQKCQHKTSEDHKKVVFQRPPEVWNLRPLSFCARSRFLNLRRSMRTVSQQQEYSNLEEDNAE